MRALILLITALLCAAAPALAEELLIVQSGRDRSSTELRQSVIRTVPVTTQVLVLSDYAEVDLPRIVREEQPDVILTIGEAALKSAKKVRGVPVVAVMALSLDASQRIPANVTGIDLRIEPTNYMNIFKAMGLKQVGVEYDRARSGAYLARAQHAAAQAGIELVLRPAKDPKEAVKKLDSLKGNVTDCLWLVPDVSVMSSLALEADVNFSLEQKKPIISYTKEHLNKGAAVALNLDWAQMGMQAGGITNRLLNGAAPQDIPVQSPQAFFLRSNESVLRNLGISSIAVKKLFP